MGGWLFQTLVVLAGTIVLSVVFRRPAELRYSTFTVGLTVLSLIVPGGRVLTIPFALVLIMIWIFWAARRSAEREEL
jgi:hypothetical protein